MTRRPHTPRSKPLLRDETSAMQSNRIGKRDPAQPKLSFDPMPDRVEPALALLTERPPLTGDWGWEIKWDGYRLHVHIEGRRVKVLTRNGFDWTSRFPAIAEAAQVLGPASMILDGEAVVLDEQGRADFSLLQKSLGASGRRIGNRASTALFYAFDLLYLDGHDMRHAEYRTRRHLLEETLRGHDGAILLSEEVHADPAELLVHACSLGLEGVVGKRQDRPYRSGRTGDWIKLKCIQSEAFMVIGYEPSAASRAGFGSLLLAAYRNDDLVYVGSVGTGFKERDATELRKKMDRLPWRQKEPPVPYSGKRDVVWLQPTLIAEIEFRAWTKDEKLRHPSYKGLRELQDNAVVYCLDGQV